MELSVASRNNINICIMTGLKLKEEEENKKINQLLESIDYDTSEIDKMIIVNIYPLDFPTSTCAIVNKFYGDADIVVSHLDSLKMLAKQSINGIKLKFVLKIRVIFLPTSIHI
mmetsp:Transcript_18420/g.22551  ORF Transcript_18420/g.22551 Transcript_18420/m.22551 type:complete len:113 (-) Transcript_18420:288-626(-)